jgi:hypothetical protein
MTLIKETKIRISNSFTPEEIEFMDEILTAAQSSEGKIDLSAKLNSPEFKGVYRKFLSMRKKVEEKKQAGTTPPAAEAAPSET